MTTNNNINQEEINKFSAYENEWWNKDSYTSPLHRINPLRLEYIKRHANLDKSKCIDVGCGGGILTEEIAKSGANTTGIDATETAIKAAKKHAEDNKLNINYQHTTIEDFLPNNIGKYNVATCLELLEHVPNPEKMVANVAELLTQDGIVFFSTINRNPKSFLLAIVGAEYVLRMIPKGTHNYKQLIKPSELDDWCKKCGLEFIDMIGINYNPLTNKFYTSNDTDVNYLTVYRKTI